MSEIVREFSCAVNTVYIRINSRVVRAGYVGRCYSYVSSRPTLSTNEATWVHSSVKSDSAQLRRLINHNNE